MKYAITVDIGGTNTRVALIDETYTILERSAFSTDAHDPRANVLMIKEVISSFHKDVVGIGVSCPGPLDLKKGVVLTPPNLPGWHGFELVQECEHLIGLRTVLENDANLACLGEAVVGAGKGERFVQYFTVSTGIGGGFVVDQQIFQGAHGFAQEVANVILLPEGPKVGGLQEGSLESICSGTAITKRAQNHGLNVTHAGEVNELAIGGNYRATKIMESAKEYMGNAVAMAYAFLDPDVVVLGGGVALKVDGFVEAVEVHARNKVYGVVRDLVKVRKAKLGDDSGLIGGGILALTLFGK